MCKRETNACQRGMTKAEASANVHYFNFRKKLIYKEMKKEKAKFVTFSRLSDRTRRKRKFLGRVQESSKKWGRQE